ncbi:cysteine proteinase [Rhizoclosmatium globosum]|uniref:Ubiquitin carboxyl-terminal hydrolase n=1 Tax=Rhizoclosmatium globosum TaxID=329046 RepID=A0A1Y2D164_9FUNG|nr:cysteine proteinase [Rhizoclosmatium globosum]|eukprot:ORY52345.1 cysteine proteinase [Rhizoclosmatium globosum]
MSSTAGGETAARVALFIGGGCRSGHEWARVVSAQRFDESARVVCQDCNIHVLLAKDAESLPKKCPVDSAGRHHLHSFVSPSDWTSVCCICEASTGFTLARQALAQPLIDQLFKAKSIDDRLYILSVLITYVKGYLEANGKPINSKNPKFAQYIGGSNQLAVEVMASLGFSFNKTDELYYPVDPAFETIGSSLPQRKHSLFVLEELTVLDWNLKIGLQKANDKDKSIVDKAAGQSLIFGWLGADVTAYNLFNLPAPSSDKPEKYPAHILTTLFQSKAEEQPNLLDELRAGLKIVGEDQGCEDAIELFLETGPIGLENFGNICYLNALIQFYVTIKPLRESVLHHVPDLSHWPRPKNPERFLQLLKDLFLRLSERGGETVSVAVGRDLAVAVLGGWLFPKMVGEVEVDAMEIDGESKKVDSKDLLLNVQQDVGEFMEVFLDMAEKGFANFGILRGQIPSSGNLFFGKTIETLKYLDASGAPKTLIREDEVASSLTLHLKRVQYDVEKGCAVKTDTFMKYYDEIDLGKYFEPPEHLTSKKYRLHAVLQHEGEAGFGHYRIYIRNHESTSDSAAWFLYDDSRVSLISKSVVDATVFKDSTGLTANAYCLMYVEAEKLIDIVQTFVRV